MLKKFAVLVSIPFKREGGSKVLGPYDKVRFIVFQFPSNGKVDPKIPHSAPNGTVAPYTPKPYANCAGHFFAKNCPKIPQTLMNIEPYAIFRVKRFGSKTPSMFLGNLCGVRTGSGHRVCVYKYTRNL